MDIKEILKDYISYNWIEGLITDKQKEDLEGQLDLYINGNSLLNLCGVVSSKPKPKSLRQIIEERRTNLCLTAETLKKDGKNETFFVGKYELLDNILNEFDGIEDAN